MKKKNTKKKYLLLTAAVLTVILIGGLSARYIQTRSSDAMQAAAENFYFTVDLLGDDAMVAQADETYAFPVEQSGEWELEGIGEHKISIEVRNFSDELRITQDTITYTASVTAPSGINATLAVKNGDPIESGSERKLAGKTSQTDTLQLTIPEITEAQYKAGVDVVVRLSASKPYSKTITLTFKRKKAEQNVTYQVKDSKSSPYVELIIMNNIDGGVSAENVNLVWPKDLSIDNTNELTFTYNGSFNQEEIKTDSSGDTYTMPRISRDLKQDESVSIYFFKTDASKIYTENQTLKKDKNGNYIVTPTADGKYMILVQ